MNSRAFTTLHTFYSTDTFTFKDITPHSQKLNLSDYYVSLSVRCVVLRE
nr:MAG TPA: hypothetical protein [Bacteriophage sp.]